MPVLEFGSETTIRKEYTIEIIMMTITIMKAMREEELLTLNSTPTFIQEHLYMSGTFIFTGVIFVNAGIRGAHGTFVTATLLQAGITVFTDLENTSITVITGTMTGITDRQ